MDDRFTWIELRFEDGGTRVSGTHHASFGHSVLDHDGRECGVSGGWRLSDDTLTIENDLHGYLPLYVHLASDRIIVSDSPLPILSRLGRRELDPIALGFFCRAGFLIGNRTLFHDIRRVPSGARMVWKAGTLETDVADWERNDPPKSIKEAVDGWADRFRVAMNRRRPAGQSFDLPLSGGRDSRMILLELNRLGHRPRRVLSLGSPASSSSSDIGIASHLARQLDLPFHPVLQHDLDWTSVERERHVACGFEALEHAWLMPLWRELLDGDAFWYDGLGVGSLTRNSAASPEMTEMFRRGEFSQWSDALYALTAATSSRWLDAIIDSVPFEIGDADSVLSDLENELANHLHAPNPITSFTFENWGRRSIALNPLGICRAQPRVELPFMDRDLVSWARSIPVEMMHRNDIQTEVCHRLYPEWSEVPFDDGAPPSRPSPSLWLRYLRRRHKKSFFQRNARYFGTLPFQALGDSNDKVGAHRALVLMFHLACVDTLVSGH